MTVFMFMLMCEFCYGYFNDAFQAMDMDWDMIKDRLGTHTDRRTWIGHGHGMDIITKRNLRALNMFGVLKIKI
jgi:hypothetical protein